MVDKKRSFSTVIKYLVITFIFFLLVIIGIGELVVRLTTKESPYYKKANLDDELGWVTSPNLDMKYDGEDKAGVKYPVHYQTFKNGFRIYGDPNTKKKKVLFVGDSYIQSVEVSNDKLFYKILADSLDFEVWAYGQAGYGTLQEYLVLKNNIKAINPDLVVIQTCDNDFIDNYAPLEYYSGYKVGLRRPYMSTEGKIMYRRPVPKWQELIDKSKFLKIIRLKLVTVFPPKKVIKTETRIPRDHKKYNDYATCLKITSNIVGKMRELVGDKEILGFSASSYEPQLSDFNDIFVQNNISFIANPAKNIDTIRSQKKVVNSSDGYHWNELGHRIIANSLKESVSLMLSE